MIDFFELREGYKTPAEAQAMQDGRKAARQGKKYSDNPHKKGSKEFTAWSNGHNQGRTTHKESVDLDEAKISVGDRVTLQPNKNTLDQSLIGKAGVVTGMLGSKPTVKFANGKTIAVSPKDLKINESVELDEASYPLAKKWQSGAKVVKKGKVELTRGSGGVHSIKVNGKSVGDFSLDNDAGLWVANINGKKGQGVYDEIDDIVNAMMKESVELDELSNDTLKSYRKKAVDDVASGKKTDKRVKGVERSSMKIRRKEFSNLYRKEAKEEYPLYHKTYSGAMQAAYAYAKKKGFEVDNDDIDRKVATGPRKPSNGKTNSFTLKLVGQKNKMLAVQVTNLDNQRYELNTYIT